MTLKTGPKNISDKQAEWFGVRHRSRTYRLLVIFGFPVFLLGGAAILWFFDPEKVRILIPCLFHAVTGLDCIGCGTTRALHALLHGRIATAASYNLFMMIWLPLPLWSMLAEWLHAVAGKPVLPRIRDYRWLMIALVASAIAFIILRNLPWAPFDWLAA